MKFISTDLANVIVIEPDLFRDERGFFLETFRADKYARGGIDVEFRQDNQSRSTLDTIRGLHAQRLHPQGKLVRVLTGSILDVVVDIRRGSPSYLRWIAVELSADNFRQIYVPPGYAHGICITSDFADVEYKCTDYYNPADEIRIAWSDPSIGIDWPVVNPILSDKDRAAPTLTEQESLLPFYREAQSSSAEWTSL
jgi:dTDP-4-dehydrorhamnose 3,5-epimerase